MNGPDPADQLSPEAVDALVNSWIDPARPLSKHLRLAVAAGLHRTRRNLPPLLSGEPIPGCDCPECTGIAADAPARQALFKRCDVRAARRKPLDVSAARNIPLLEVARRLGLSPVRPHPNVAEHVMLCPLHGDTRPSLRMDPSQNLWYCFPCAEGGDGIRLVERVRGGTFADAVRFLNLGEATAV